MECAASRGRTALSANTVTQEEQQHNRNNQTSARCAPEQETRSVRTVRQCLRQFKWQCSGAKDCRAWITPKIAVAQICA